MLVHGKWNISAALLLANFTLPHLKYFVNLSESYVKVKASLSNAWFYFQSNLCIDNAV